MGVNNHDARVNVFVHGYRAVVSEKSLERTRQQIFQSGAAGENYLLQWGAGGWGHSVRSTASTLAGLRAAYRVARVKNLFAPWMLLVDAGVIGLSEVAQFKKMERRAEQVGRELPALLAIQAAGRPVNLIGHSLGARVVHHALALEATPGLHIEDVVLLAGAADMHSDSWPKCLKQLNGRIYNAFAPRDPILRITPDLRRRIGGGPMPAFVVNGEDKVVNEACKGVGHTTFWSKLGKMLPEVWPACRETLQQ